RRPGIDFIGLGSQLDRSVQLSHVDRAIFPAKSDIRLTVQVKEPEKEYKALMYWECKGWVSSRLPRDEKNARAGCRPAFQEMRKCKGWVSSRLFKILGCGTK
ncbi:hypothetical protein PIB30_062523, partial [Stylosanthes scabra]|nr:hypothetical protein [Stylosanthes scabra]